MSQQCARDLLRGRSHQASGFCLIETVPWKRVRKSVCLLQRSPAVQERARAARYNIHSASAPDVLRPQRPSVIAPPIPPRHLKKRECRFSVGEGRKLTSTPVGAAKPPVRGPSTQRRQRCPTADPRASGRSQHLCALAMESLRRQRGEPSCIPIFKNQRSPRLCAKLAGPEYLRRTTQRAKQPNSMLPGGVRRVPSRQMPRGKP